MSDKTKIEWTDATWSPVTGCSVVSAGCKHCYAMKLAGTRLQHHPSRVGLTVDTKAGPVWTGEVRFNEQWIDQPIRWKRPRMVFVCAHADLFHESVPFEWIDKVFAVMALAPQHTFQVLTKRPERMRDYFRSFSEKAAESRGFNVCAWADQVLGGISDEQVAAIGSTPKGLPNVWLGVSVEDQAAADERIPLLFDTPATVRWISAEPMLGPVDLKRWAYDREEAIRNAMNSPAAYNREQAEDGIRRPLDWVVVGGESGPNARPMHPDWARSLRDQCAVAGVPFMFKQWGEWAPHSPIPGGDEARDLRNGIVKYMIGDGREFDGHFRRGDAAVRRVGKKAAARLLDGVQHDGYPEGGA